MTIFNDHAPTVRNRHAHGTLRCHTWPCPRIKECASDGSQAKIEAHSLMP